MAQQTINNGETGLVIRGKLNGNFTELYSDLTAHVGAGGSAHAAVTGGSNGFMIAADKTKLDGIASGATANSTDAFLLARANHTGTQVIATVQAVASSRLFGRITASGGAGEELTGTQATTLLDVATSSLKGLAPASGGGTTNFLRADMTWAAPAGGGGYAVNYCLLTADYNLANVATEQQIFDTTANGELMLPTGVYRFKAMLAITTMSATSGNAAFDPIGAGTAVGDRFSYYVTGIDNNNALTIIGNTTGGACFNQQSAASMVTAGVGTAMTAMITGVFRISTAGTIIPSITLVTANAAVMKAGTFFEIEQIGESADAFVGAWT